MNGNGHTNGRSNEWEYADSFNVKASLRSIAEAAQHYRLMVLSTCVLTLGLVALYIYAWPPIYSVEATIMSEPDYDYQRDTFYTGWDVFRKDDPRTEIALITSGPVLGEVVKRENLTYDDVYHPVLSQLSYFWEKSWVGRNYRAVKKMIFSDHDDKDAPSQADLDFGRTVVDLSAGIDMSPVGESNVGKLKVKGPSRKVARIANTLMDVYLAGRIERHLAEAQSSYDTLKEEVAKSGKELKVLSDRRVVYSEKNSLFFDFQKENMEVAKLTDLEASIASSRMRIAAMEASLREVEKQLAKETPTRTTATVFEINTVRESTKLKRVELQATLIAARDRYREDSPEVKEILGDLSKLDALIAESSEKVEKGTTEGLNMAREQLTSSRNGLRTELEGSRAGLAVMEETAVRMRSRLAAVPALQDALMALDRELAAATEKFKQLLVKQGQAAVSLATSRGTIQSVRVVEYATPPGEKTWPKSKYLYPSGLLVGLMLGVGAAVLRSTMSGRILREHVEHGRGAVPLYGTISIATEARPFKVAPRDSADRPTTSGQN